MTDTTDAPGSSLVDSVTYSTDTRRLTVEEEREHRTSRLVAAVRTFSDLGFDEGVAGHITVRDPEDPESFWVNPYGVHFSLVRRSDLVRLDADGRVVAGRHRVNKAAFAIHHAIHRARPDVVAAAHAHTVHGRAWSTLGRPVAPIVQEACAFLDNHAVVSDYGGLITEDSEAEAVVKGLGHRRAVTLMHHGNITVGGSVEEAAWWFVVLDRCCRIQLLAEAAGTPARIPPEGAALAARQFGSPAKARVSFEMLYQVALAKHPDMLD
ncbi:class II aldolase/adducin family protein [Saccharothrix algeriensis]|uniref:Class II aldolase/adducin family protein n=1 Tax=Saccharothrix algeriensis TaxID=173560 RepID=A0A8T8I2B3_9PSEU|nr:class II aldolase/adducin family protein [Saccharothrix algeriensis]MBM7809863.1 ribulose-5-phosphate 4-epimerase/fuculose-1-phosphate aldolase [Saccharothrix algeriensis]QTR04124.1 class II aldolase/adducin family protein [Saccharothrix algeriensis]